jgi:hypothetical protein
MCQVRTCERSEPFDQTGAPLRTAHCCHSLQRFTLRCSFPEADIGKGVFAIVSIGIGLLLAVFWAYSHYELNCVELFGL